MATTSLNHILARWIPERALDQPQVNCGACAKPNKCCDFQPFVANFLLGAWLEQGGELRGDAVWAPIGLVASREFREQHALGNRDLSCVFFSGDKCQIWSLRPGECSSYVCGAPDMSRARLSERAFALESAVAQMALVYQGFTPREIAAQVDILNGSGGRQPSPPPVEFYLRTWAWAKSLSQADITQFFKGEFF